MIFLLLCLHRSLWPFLSTSISLLCTHKLSVLNLLLTRCCNKWGRGAKTDGMKETVKCCLKRAGRMTLWTGDRKHTVWYCGHCRDVLNLIAVLVSVWQNNGYHIFLHNCLDLRVQCCWFSSTQVSWYHQGIMLWMQMPLQWLMLIWSKTP
jgi:hypothetical protein